MTIGKEYKLNYDKDMIKVDCSCEITSYELFWIHDYNILESIKESPKKVFTLKFKARNFNIQVDTTNGITLEKLFTERGPVYKQEEIDV